MSPFGVGDGVFSPPSVSQAEVQQSAVERAGMRE